MRIDRLIRNKRRHRARMWGNAAALAAAPLAAAGAGWLVQQAGLAIDARRHPPPGLLLSRGGRYLHVMEQGSGWPPVVFEAGLAASSLSWARVQPLVAAFATTASYDRAGLGWSSSPSHPPNMDALLDDLESVVKWAGDGQPVVLCGHSFGALLVSSFTRRSPELVAGLVLVDPMSFATWSACTAADLRRVQVGAALSRRGAWLAEFGVVRAALALLTHGGRPLSQVIGRRAAGRGAATLERLTGEVSKLPRELWPTIAAHWSRPQSFRAMAAMLEALPALAAAAERPVFPAGLPVAILSAASATEAELAERDGWLLGVTAKEHTVLPETGHWLHLDRADEVAAAVRWCVEHARN